MCSTLNCIHFETDCGAGIGRVSKLLLLPLFSEVDLVEQNPAFLEKAKVYLVRDCGIGGREEGVGDWRGNGLEAFVLKY